MMAANPLFHSVTNKRKFIQSPPPASAAVSAPAFKPHSMSGPPNEARGSEPPEKKIRIDPASRGSAGDDLSWDDNEEFTDDMLENIDHMIASSQQVSVLPNPGSGTGSHIHTHRQPISAQVPTREANNNNKASDSRLVGKGSSKSRSAGEMYTTWPSGTNLCQTNAACAGPVSVKFQNKQRTLLKNTPEQLGFSGRTAPESLHSTANKSQGYHSMSDATPSHNQQQAMQQLRSKQVTPVTLSRTGGRGSPALPTDAIAKLDGPETFKRELEKTRGQAEKYKSELQAIRDAQYGKDGQIKILRDNLSAKELELHKVKEEQLTYIEEETRRQSESEKQMERELQRLKTQLQFKEQEIGEVQSRFKKLEKQVASGGGTMPVDLHSPRRTSSSAGSPLLQPHSPRRGGMRLDTNSPSKHGFPNTQTFMAGGNSPRAKAAKSIAGHTDRGVQVDKSGPSVETSRTQPHRMRLKVSCPKGNLQGPQLISKLMVREAGNAAASVAAAASRDGGQVRAGHTVMDILQRPPSPVDVSGLTLERDVCSWALSPRRPCANRTGTSSSAASADSSITALAASTPVSTCSVRSSVHSESLALAWDAMRSLLQQQSKALAIHDQLSKDSADDLLKDCGCNAVLFLPAIDDYLGYYLKVFTSVTDVSCLGSTPLCLSRGSSLESGATTSSLDSLASSFSSLAVHGANYLNQLEEKTLHVLQILNTLVDYNAHVRAAICQKDASSEKALSLVGTSSQGISSSLKKEQPSLSSSEDAPKQVPSYYSDSSDVSSNMSTKKIVRDNNLLKNLLLLANPVQKENKCSNGQICAVSLRSLTRLAEGCSEQQLDRFNVHSLYESLLSCFSEDCKLSVACRFNVSQQALSLLLALARSATVTNSLCTHADECILSALLHMCVDPCPELNAEQVFMLCSKMVAVLFAILSSHKNGVTMLVEANCHCSVELVKSMVVVLHRQYSMQCQAPGSSSLQMLRSGVSLLHQLWLRDPLFARHRQQVEHQYVELICGMDQLLRDGESNGEDTEVTCLQELWDFEQEYPDGSGSQQDPELHEDPDNAVQKSGTALLKTEQRDGPKEEEPMDVIMID